MPNELNSGVHQVMNLGNCMWISDRYFFSESTEIHSPGLDFPVFWFEMCCHPGVISHPIHFIEYIRQNDIVRLLRDFIQIIENQYYSLKALAFHRKNTAIHLVFI